ncbi:MAG: MGMT family protein, partial [Pseudomonadales bacterium]
MTSQDNEAKRESIWQVVHMIPSGKVAALAGLPQAARFTGTSLKNLPTTSTIPWHRVINAQGKISLPRNSPSYKKQLQRLKEEGVIIRNGKV